MSAKDRRKNRRAKGPKPAKQSKPQQIKVTQPPQPPAAQPVVVPAPPADPPPVHREAVAAERDNYIQGLLLLAQVVALLITGILGYLQSKEHRLEQAAQNEQRAKDEAWRQQEAKERKEQFETQLERQQKEHDEANAPYLAFTSPFNQLGVVQANEGSGYRPVNVEQLKTLFKPVNLLFPHSPIEDDPPKENKGKTNDVEYPTVVNYGRGPAIDAQIEFVVELVNGEPVKGKPYGDYKPYLPNGMQMPLAVLPRPLKEKDSPSVEVVTGHVILRCKRLSGEELVRKSGFVIMPTLSDQFNTHNRSVKREYYFFVSDTLEQAKSLAKFTNNTTLELLKESYEDTPLEESVGKKAEAVDEYHKQLEPTKPQ